MVLDPPRCTTVEAIIVSNYRFVYVERLIRPQAMQDKPLPDWALEARGTMHG